MARIGWSIDAESGGGKSTLKTIECSLNVNVKRGEKVKVKGDGLGELLEDGLKLANVKSEIKINESIKLMLKNQ